MSKNAHAARYREIVRIMADEGFGSLADQLGLTKLAPLREAARKVSPHANLDIPVEVRARLTLERLGPTFVKIGQAVSTRADLIPRSYARELTKLQDEVTPEPFDVVDGVILAEFGVRADELFASFEHTPLAAASLGQVHAATLPDGTAVAVKVQRPGVRELVDVDLDILASHADRITDYTEYGERINASAIAEEFARAVRDELDYITEGRNAERLRIAFRDDETVFFPRVHWEYTSPRVLTMDRIEGIALNHPEQLEAAGLSRPEIARRGMYAYLTQIFELGFYQADPHPGNLFALPDGRVGFTDFGRTCTLSSRSRDQIADLFLAIIDQDDVRAVDTLLDASRNRSADIDKQQLQMEVSRLINKYYNAKLGEIEVGELFAEVLNLTRVNGLGLPSDVAVLLSTLAVLEGVGARLDPDFDFVEVTAPFARRIVSEQMLPENLGRQALRSLRSSMKILGALPETLQRFMSAASAGEFRVTVRPGGLDPVLNRLEAVANRISFAVVIAAFILGFSILLSRTPIPEGFMWFARVALVFAAGIGAWFFLSIFLSRYGKRH